jgi:cytochrome c
MVKTTLFMFVLSFLLVFGCSKGKEESSAKKTQTETTKTSQDVGKKVEEAASEVGEAVKKKTAEVTEAAKEKTEEAATAVKEMAEDVTGPDGEKIFKSKGCAGCHQPENDTVGPSLKKISQVYKEKNGDLVKFLKGEEESIVTPEKAGMMKPLLNPIHSLSDEEFEALADYILQH